MRFARSILMCTKRKVLRLAVASFVGSGSLRMTVLEFNI